MRFSYETLSLSPSEFAILRDLIREHTGWSFHHLRHSSLTHAAEDGT